MFHADLCTLFKLRISVALARFLVVDEIICARVYYYYDSIQLRLILLGQG